MLDSRTIIILLGNWQLGGAERQALLLARHLQNKEGARVEVWGLGRPGRVSNLCELWGLPWKQINLQLGTGLAANALSLIPVIRKIRHAAPDVLLPYTWFPNVLCGLIWRFSGSRTCIWNQRDSGISLDPKRVIHRFAALLTPFFISNSTHASMFLKDRFGVDEKRLAVVPNGVRLEVPRDDRITWRHRLGVDENVFVGCMVANFSLTKDHATAVRAWRLVVDKLASHHRRGMLILAGRDDGTVSLIRPLIRELDLDRDVRILDSVDDVTGLLFSADLGVHCSEAEGCPNSVLEKMAAGLPVVATDNEGVRMVLGEGAETFIAPHQNAEGIAQRILQFALDSEYGTNVGRNNKQRISDCYSVETMCRETARFIDHALKHAG